MAVVLMGIWMGHFRKGFAWSENPDLEFNWHPLLMTLGMIFLYGNGKDRIHFSIKVINFNEVLYHFFICYLTLYRFMKSFLHLLHVNMFFLSGILIYRVFRHERKKKLKLTHAIMMISSFLLTVIGLKAVFDSHNLKMDPTTKKPAPIANLYSLHSWMGIITVILFAMQVKSILNIIYNK